ncbi:XRE family transcriptional regulator [Coriobacterium glomerans]|nr:XRE family transcriptional regulator [Coriobacterium glomerans]
MGWRARDATKRSETATIGDSDRPLTEELLHELLSSPDPETYLNAHELLDTTVSRYLGELLASKGMKRIDVVRSSGINETFGYQIFKGQRNASRNKLLQIAIAMGCDLMEVNRLLKIAGVNELYCRNRRDAIIIFCIDRGDSLQKINEELFVRDEETIYNP